MRVLLVVVFERDGQIANGRRCVRLRHEGNVIALHCLYEARGHAIIVSQQLPVQRTVALVGLESHIPSVLPAVSGRKSALPSQPGRRSPENDQSENQ